MAIHQRRPNEASVDLVSDGQLSLSNSLQVQAFRQQKATRKDQTDLTIELLAHIISTFVNLSNASCRPKAIGCVLSPWSH